MSLPMTPAFLIRSLGVLQSCLTVGLLGIVMLFYISCSSRNNATNHSCEEVALTGRECKDSNLSLLRSQTLDVAVPQSLEIRAIPARVSQPPTSDHRVMRASHQPKPPELEDWMANQLGSGVKVRLGRACWKSALMTSVSDPDVTFEVCKVAPPRKILLVPLMV